MNHAADWLERLIARSVSGGRRLAEWPPAGAASMTEALLVPTFAGELRCSLGVVFAATT